MKKAAIVLIFFFNACIRVFGQGYTVESSQMMMMSLSNVIEISFTGNNSSFAAPVAMAFKNPSDFINGIESAPQEIRVRTNKAFNVNVKAKTNSFEYNGPQFPAPKIPVDNTLSMSVTDNGTGGTLAPGTGGKNQYFGVTQENKSVIVGGGTGNNQKYSVKYKAKPGYNVPDGTYAVDLIYTASQE